VAVDVTVGVGVNVDVGDSVEVNVDVRVAVETVSGVNPLIAEHPSTNKEARKAGRIFQFLF